MSGEWLNDKHINAAQQLLKERYPIISGFQDTTLQLTRTYHIQKGKIFVQILHVNHNHWVTISTVNCGPNTVKIYDTMHEELSMESKTVIADLLQTSERYIKLEYVNVQRQIGGADCGLLAIAIATAICCGQHPELLEIEQDKAREHLKSSFEQKLLNPFPSRPVSREPCIGEEKLHIYCYCRQIDDGQRMVICDKCDSWFHVACVKISAETLKKFNRRWFCRPCREHEDKPRPSIYTYERVASEIRAIKVSVYLY